MIPLAAEVGLLIAAYIITRMLAMLGKWGVRFARVFAVITLALAALIAYDLLVPAAVSIEVHGHRFDLEPSPLRAWSPWAQLP
jgi:hypothetical protein